MKNINKRFLEHNKFLRGEHPLVDGEVLKVEEECPPN
jgi:hypothetical protein